MKIVVVSPRFPYPLEKGDKLRLYHQLKTISLYHDIVLISLSDSNIHEEDIRHIKTLVSKLHILKLSKFKIALRLLLGFRSKLPFQVLYFYNKTLKTKIHKIIKDENPDIIYNQLLRTAQYTRELDKIFKVIDYMDSFSQGMKKRLDNSNFLFKKIYATEYKRLKNYEKDIFYDFDKHSIISQQDKNTFHPDIKYKLTVIPNGVDIEYFSPMNTVKQYDIGFVGNMGYRPNIIASEFIYNKIYPDLIQKRNNLKILLAGARPHFRVKRLANDNITISGWMEDIRTAYAQSKIFVAPIFTGIGQQNKILEAMSMQIPVITSSPVNNAIGAIKNRDIIIANNKEEFVNAISSLLQDPQKREEIGKNGRKFVQNNYSWEHHNKKLLALLEHHINK